MHCASRRSMNQKHKEGVVMEYYSSVVTVMAVLTTIAVVCSWAPTR